MKTPRTVLIVDDSDDDLFVARYVIGRCWPEAVILTAPDGEQALDLLAQQARPPDVVFLDMRMPGMDGAEFLSRWPVDPAHDASVVVVLTAHGRPDDRQRALGYDCVRDYVVKPLSVEKLEQLQRLVP